MALPIALPFSRMPGARHTVTRDEARARPAAPAEPTGIAGVRLRVLVVDDDDALRSTCSSLLKLSGYDVTLASRGQEALDLLRRCGYDIVLVDLQMTHVDGLALLRTALATRRDTVVIMMTDNPSLDSCIEALRQGAWDYLPKPFSAAHLQILVGRAAHTLQIAHQARDIESGATEAPSPSEALTLLGTAPASSRSTAPRSPRHCSNRRCSGTARAPSPAPYGINPDCSKPQMAARCFSTS